MRNLLPKINSKDGQFHNGNPSTGEQGTRVTAEWLNDVQNHLQDFGIEMRYLLAKAAMTPDPAKQTQIYDALINIINDNHRRASTTAVGEVQLTNDTGLDSESLGLTAKAGKALAQAIAAVKLSLNNYIPLNKRSDSVVSTSSDTVATSKAANTAYNKGAEAKTAADNAQKSATEAANLAKTKATAHTTVTNLNTLSGSQFFGCYDSAIGVPSDLANSNADFNGIHADAGYQKFQLLVVTHQDIRIRYQDDGANWSNWEQFGLKKHIDAKVNKSGDTITGKLMIKYAASNAWSALHLGTTDGEWRLEVHPNSTLANQRRFNMVFATATEQTYLWFPHIGDGDTVAYRSWVSTEIAKLWTADQYSAKASRAYVEVKVENAGQSGLTIKRTGTSGNWLSRIEALDDKRWKFWTENGFNVYLPAKSGTIALTSDLTKANVGLGNVQNYGASDTGGTSNYVLRNAAGDIVVRTLKSTYVDEGYCKGAIAFRVNNGTDNHTRYCNNPAAVRSWLQLAPTRRDYSRTIKGVRTWDNGSQRDINISGQVIAATDGRIEQFFHYKNFRVPWFDLEDAGKDGARGYIIPCQLWTAMPNKVTKVQIQFIRATGATNQSTTYLAEAGEWLTAWAYYKQGTNKSQIWINVNRVEGDQDNHIDMLVWVEGY
ncbi:hypothetical protein [Caviibacterium pharyngocola]|uniref:Phage tail protein n=1 Tax=Caviibacterium pharyngocola TaxID=28159 RepID=A0A2M8RXY9_9PAST|nr:hypothetical protein [Caviibacterium pharyngocola]PJG83759.1 hypothetical protein CVP04_01310 [Caviibacterium pharyngocola]